MVVNTIMGSLLELLDINGIGLLTIFILANGWIIRYILAYQKETREEYRSRLNDAIMELEQQKTLNIRLELKNQTLEFRLSKIGKES